MRIRMLSALAIAVIGISLPSSAEDGRSVFQVKSRWEDQAGTPVTLKSFKGRTIIATMVYTSCSFSCPLTIANLQRIEKQLSAKQKEDVQFVLFSFDSARDQAATLRSFAERRSLDSKRWVFLHGSSAAVREIALILGVRYKRNDAGEYDHSNVVSLIDPNGVIRFRQEGLRSDPAEFLKELGKVSS